MSKQGYNKNNGMGCITLFISIIILAVFITFMIGLPLYLLGYILLTTSILFIFKIIDTKKDGTKIKRFYRFSEMNSSQQIETIVHIVSVLVGWFITTILYMDGNGNFEAASSAYFITTIINILVHTIINPALSDEPFKRIPKDYPLFKIYEENDLNNDNNKDFYHSHPLINKAYNANTYYELEDCLSVISTEYMSAITFSGKNADFIFTAPAILDSSVPATAEFLDSLENTRTIIETTKDKRLMNTEPNDNDKTIIVDMIEKWDNAVEFARHNILTAIPHEKHNKVKSLLNVVLINDTSNNEAYVARNKLVNILSNIEYEIPVRGTNHTRTTKLRSENIIDNGKHIYEIEKNNIKIKEIED